jgi:isopentenyl-diphosphate Delta-isomerase
VVWIKINTFANRSENSFVTTLLNDTGDNIQTRKADHLRICLDETVQCQGITTGLERYRFQHCCLPELDYNEISLKTQFFNKTLAAPFLISSMTGGTDIAKLVNQRLARVAQQYGIAMGVGSQRIALERPDVADTFAVRSIAPDVLLFANLGAVQLNYGCTVADAQRLVDVLEADALILHLNPLQECIQSHGDRNFRGLFAKIERLCRDLSVPVIAKEVGNGISAPMATRLIEVGIAALDVAGAGGTSWAKVEGERAQEDLQRNLGQSFADWGIPTVDCLTAIRAQHETIPLIASGGLRNGLDAAKAIALGADLVGMAYPFLKAAFDSESALLTLMDTLIAELKTTLLCTGNADPDALRQGNSLIKLQN